MTSALLSIVLLALPAFALGQPACRQVASQVSKQRSGFTIQTVTWRSAHGLVSATASIPDATKPIHATVFSFSTLVGSGPHEFVDMMPLAIDLTEQGWATIVIDRKLTWPEVDPSVGTMRADVMCAEHWLSKHATVKPSDWIFVGPDPDAPDVGDGRLMTGWLGFLVGDKPGDPDTERLFHGTSDIRTFILAQHFMEK